MIKIIEVTLQLLLNEMDTLVFYKNSAHKPVGKGVHEVVQDPIIYEMLNNIPNWRRVLCSQWSNESFRYDKYSFRSVDHALQYAKFAICNYVEVAYKFTMESGDLIGCSDGLIAYRNRKLMLLSMDELSVWFSVKSQINYDIVYCKFSQIELARTVLLATKSAMIYNIGPRITAIRCYTIEKVRASLQSSIR